MTITADPITLRLEPEHTRRRRPANRAALLATIGLCLTLALGVAASWQQPGSLQDEGLLIEYPLLTLHGQLPFGDYQSSYGIGSYLPLAAAYELAGPSVSTERTVGAVYRVAVVLAIVALLASLGTAVLITGGGLAVVGILGPGPPVAYGWYAALACVLWSIWLARGAPMFGARTAWRLVGAGLLLGFAVSARPDILLAACAAGLLVLPGRTGAQRRRFVAGALAGLSPLILNVMAAGPSAFWSYGVLSRFHTLAESGARIGGPTAELAIALVGAVALLLITAIREHRANGASPITRAWLALSLVSAVSLAQVFQRPDAGHFAFVAPLILGLLPWAVDSVIRLRMRVAVVITAVCVAAVLVHAADRVNGYPIRAAGRSFPDATRTEQRDYQRAINFVDRHTSPGQKLFVGPLDLRWALGEDTALYYLMPQLRPSSFYLELGPGDNTMRFYGRELSALRASSVLVLRAVEPTVHKTIYPYAEPGSNILNRVVVRDFRLAFRSGTVTVWLRRQSIMSVRGVWEHTFVNYER